MLGSRIFLSLSLLKSTTNLKNKELMMSQIDIVKAEQDFVASKRLLFYWRLCCGTHYNSDFVLKRIRITHYMKYGSYILRQATVFSGTVSLSLIQGDLRLYLEDVWKNSTGGNSYIVWFSFLCFVFFFNFFTASLR